MPRCSVIIPYMDRIDLLRWTLRSLARQTTDISFEVLVVDDGSEVAPETMLDAQDLPANFEVLHQDNRGSAAARNTGWLHAKGDIVIFLDCDQITKPDFIEQHCALFDAVDQPILQIATRRNLHKDAKIDLDRMGDLAFVRDERMHFFRNTSFNMTNLESSWHHCFSHNISTQRENLIRHGGFDTGFKGWGFEDCEIGYKFERAGVPLVITPGPLTFHQFHEQRMTPAKFKKWRANLDHFMAKHPTPEVNAQMVLVGPTDPDNHTSARWHIALMQLEHILRLAQNRRLAEDITLRQKFSSHSELEKLALSDDVYTTMALVDRRDTALVGRAQLDPNLKEVRLFFA